METDLTYHVVGKLDNLDPEYPLRVKIGDFDIAVFVLEGEVFATDNICTHAYASLADGYVEGESVECPLHGACFNFKTGKPLTGPATVDLRTHPVRIDGEDVVIGLPSL